MDLTEQESKQLAYFRELGESVEYVRKCVEFYRKHRDDERYIEIGKVICDRARISMTLEQNVTAMNAIMKKGVLDVSELQDKKYDDLVTKNNELIVRNNMMMNMLEEIKKGVLVNNTSSYHKGVVGERKFNETLQGFFKDSVITPIDGKLQGDCMMRRKNLLVLFEVKNKKAVHKNDMENFKRDVIGNKVNAGIMVSYQSPFPNMSTNITVREIPERKLLVYIYHKNNDVIMKCIEGILEMIEFLNSKREIYGEDMSMISEYVEDLEDLMKTFEPVQNKIKMISQKVNYYVGEALAESQACERQFALNISKLTNLFKRENMIYEIEDMDYELMETESERMNYYFTKIVSEYKETLRERLYFIRDYIINNKVECISKIKKIKGEYEWYIYDMNDTLITHTTTYVYGQYKRIKMLINGRKQYLQENTIKKVCNLICPNGKITTLMPKRKTVVINLD